MRQKTYVAARTRSLSSRAAVTLVYLAKSSKSEVWIEEGGRKRKGKRITDLLDLATRSGATLTITVDGEDEEMVIRQIANLIESDLGLS
jgi:phosphotransferase system HPr (HPr) family protein